MKPLRLLVATVATLGLTAATASAVPLPADTTALITGAPSLFDAFDAPVGDAGITRHSVSQDGRYVAFVSTSDGLATGDDDTVENVYRKDMATGEVLLMSRRDGAGGEPSHADCYGPAISDDGQRVAFTCDGALEPGDTDEFSDVYVRTPAANATVLASRTWNGAPGDGDSTEPSLSQDGEYVAFASHASNLLPGAPVARQNVYRRHLASQTTILASRKNGANGFAAMGSSPSIDDEGGRIAFVSDVQDDPADKNGYLDVYVRDVAAGTTTLASRPDGPSAATRGGHSMEPAISGNGLAVAFVSSADRLDSRDTDPYNDVYRRSLGLKTTTVVNVGASGVKSGQSWGPSIDDSGTVIGFVSTATGLDPADTDPAPDAYVKYMGYAPVGVVSRATGETGAPANRSAQATAISGDAYHAVTALVAGGITPDADPRRPQVITRDLDKHVTRSVARTAGDQPFVNAAGDSDGASVTPDGRFVAFSSGAAGLGLPATSQSGVFVRDRFTGEVTLASRTDGADGAPFPSGRRAAISADGRRVAFSAAETRGGTTQVWVRDLAEGRTFLASRADGPNGMAGDDRSSGAQLDADGSRVVFRSRAKNLGDGDDNPGQDVHVRDLETGETILVSRADGAAGAIGDGASESPDIDATGTRVSFVTYAKNLNDDDKDTNRDVHLRDLTAGTTRLVSATPAGEKANAGVSEEATMDASGTRVTFATAATNLGDPSPAVKVFVRDLGAGSLVAAGAGERPMISADGGFVAFEREGQVVRHDVAAGESRVVSRRSGADGAPALFARVAAISAQGACVAFETADQLVGPRREVEELYLRAVTADCGDPAPATGDPGGTPGGDGPVVAGGPGLDSRDTVAPVLSRVRLSKRRFRAGRGSILSFRSSEAGRLTLTVHRLRRRGGRIRVGRRVNSVGTPIAAGAGRMRIKAKRNGRALARGRYRLTLRVRDAAGNASRPVRLRFRIV